MSRYQTRERDQGMSLALASAGSAAELARRLGLRPDCVKWRRVPQHRLFAVAKATGLEPEQLRPDLADWIELEGRRRWLARAKERQALIAVASGMADDERHGNAHDLEQIQIDTLVTLAAIRFAAAERSLTIGAVIAGRSRPECQARAWAMALAHVVGRASSTIVAQVCGSTRQNVDNASERYIRARDGDDAEDFLEVRAGIGRVLENGRLRRAKEADAGLVTAEDRFLAAIESKPQRAAA